MTTAEDIQEYISDLTAQYAERKKNTYREVESAQNWLMLEYMTIVDGYNAGDFTEQQFMDLSDEITKLNDQNEALLNVKRNEWNHSSER